MSQQAKKLDTDDRPDLVESCLGHLMQEEYLLERTRADLRETRAALIRGGAESIRTALARQQRTSDASRELKERRNLLRQQIAKQLAIPEATASVLRLADSLHTNEAAILAQASRRLRQLADEIQQLNRGNAVLIHHGLAFLQQLLLEISGADGGDRYSPAGRFHSAGCGSIVSARG
jgi:hypothetical protein